MAKNKERLDKLLVELELVPTRSKAQAYIMAGDVRVDGQVVTKAGTPTLRTAKLEVTKQLPYVGRGGYKLAGALEKFPIDLTNCIAADVGSCTGGFTDVMLQQGASRVFSIDVGYGQLDWKLRQDERVTVLERTNARYLESLDEAVNFVSIDVSFISLRLILPAVKKWVQDDFDIVALIKPQFEAGRDQVGPKGIIRDPAVHRAVLERILGWCVENELYPHGVVQSSIKGGDGNIEFLGWFRPNPSSLDIAKRITELVGS